MGDSESQQKGNGWGAASASTGDVSDWIRSVGDSMVPAFFLTLTLTLVPAVLLLLHSLVNRLSVRLGHRLSGQQGAILAFILGAAIILPTVWLLIPSTWRVDLIDNFAAAAYVIMVYCSLGFCYFCFLNLSETSMHIHILQTIVSRGEMSAGELNREYNPVTMIRARITRMVELGQIVEDGGRCFSKNRFLVKGSIVFTLGRWVLGLPLRPAP